TRQRRPARERSDADEEPITIAKTISRTRTRTSRRSERGHSNRSTVTVVLPTAASHGHGSLPLTSRANGARDSYQRENARLEARAEPRLRRGDEARRVPLHARNADPAFRRIEV